MIAQALHAISGMPLEVCADLLRFSACVGIGLGFVFGLIGLSVGMVWASVWLGTKL